MGKFIFIVFLFAEMPKNSKEKPNVSLSKSIECNKENLENECRENFEKGSVMESDVIDGVSCSMRTGSDRPEEFKLRASEPANEIERQNPEDEFRESSESPRASPPCDSATPDRPGRPGVPTPGKYGTGYGGAPSPGPAPCSSFLPPGFVPPTPPVSTGSRPSLVRSGIVRKKCLENSLKTEVVCQEESQREVKKTRRMIDKPPLEKCL